MDFRALKTLHPNYSDLELHFFNMKFLGLCDPLLDTKVSRPILELWDDKNLAEIDFLVDEKDSPYSINGEEVLFEGQKLPFTSYLLGRLSLDMPYFYVRGPLGGELACPTLDDQNLLNLNHHQICSGCDFCSYGERNTNKINQSVEEILASAKKEHGLDKFDQLAFVTGCFRDEEETCSHLVRAIKFANKSGFNGRVLYIGFQLTSDKVINTILRELKNPQRFEYVYTIERFTERSQIMHGPKGKKDIAELVSVIQKLSSYNFGNLQYTYLVGIEDLDPFYAHAPKLVPYATPHISIFRRTGLGLKAECFAKDYIAGGADYLCKVRDYFESLYGHQIIGNNLANLWLFPRERVDRFRERIEQRRTK